MKSLFRFTFTLLLLSITFALATAAEPINVLVLGYGRAISAKYVDACAKDGVRISVIDADHSAGDPDYYSLDLLKKFQVVVVCGTVEHPLTSTVVGQLKKGILNMLDQYYQAGGSILWVPFGEDHGGKTWTEAIGSRYDAQGIDEALYDPAKTVSVSASAATRNLCTYTWTTDIAKHPVTDGVRGLFLPKWGEWSWNGVIPMKFGQSWQVLVRGMESTRTVGHAAPPSDGKYGPEYPGTIDKSPEIVGVRESLNGAGRMMVFPLYITWTWANFGHPGLQDALMLNGDGFHPSDGYKLLLNAYRWLAEPSTKAGLGGYQPPAPGGRPDLSPRPWNFDNPDVPGWPGGKPWKGLIGARTSYSGGKGTVADYVAEAKKLGLSYVIFLEDPAKLTEATLKSLIDDCKANSDDTFAAIPGYGYYDVQGMLRYCYPVRVLPLAGNIAPDGRIKEPSRIIFQHAYRQVNGFAELAASPVDPYWNYNVFSCAPYTFHGAKLTDDGFAQYLELEAKSCVFAPVSLVLVNSPAEMRQAAGSAYLTVFHGDAPAKIADGPENDRFYLTNGPEIRRWGSLNRDSNPFRPGANQFRLGLEVYSEAGLKEVKIINAADGSVYRRFAPQGAKSFSVTIDEAHAHQWYLCPVVTDLAGKTAMGACLRMLTDGYRLWTMSDRLMGMAHVTGWDQQRQRLVQFGGATEITFHKGIPGGGEEPSSPQRGALKIQGIDGGDIYSAAGKVRLKLTTNLGSEPQQEAFIYHIKLASHDLAVIDLVGDQQRKPDQPFNYMASGFPTIPTTLADITSREWCIRGRYRTTVSAMLYEISVTFKKDQLF
ncbi:MAG TPA: hypothetical protein VGM23_07680, partial [Armatimonadota bacterium]